MEQIICKSFAELSTDELYDILALRISVFVVEQACPYQEADGIDQRAMHLYGIEDGQIVSYLRYFESDEKGMIQIGRVISRVRRQGYGKRIMQQALSVIRQMPCVRGIVLEAQVYAIPFYESFGFVTVSEPFDEDGIMHVRMELVF